MLTRLRIQNFKAWQDTGEVRLAPITVLFGSNSSGKSSLSQFLLMLQQTAQSPDRQRVLHTGDAQTPVDLGTFRDIAFGHDERREIDFSLAWDLPSPLKIEDPRSKDKFSGDSVEFSAVVGQVGGREGRLIVQRIRYRLRQDEAPVLAVEMELEAGKAKGRDQYQLTSEGYKLVRNPGRGWPLPPPTRFYGFPPEAVAYYQNSGFIDDLALSLEKQLGRVYYLGPLRDFPRRFYTWSGISPEHVGWKGEHAVEALLAARQRKLSPGVKKHGIPFAGLIAQWLKKMELLETFDTKPLGPNRKEYEVQVRTRGSKEPVNLTDVGFGISQVLPVLVECFYAPPDSTILLEQPEIHLHPQVQAALADLFIEAIRMREDGQERRIQLIVESHSEHFLRRLQRRIAEEALKPEEAALYFVEASGPGGTSSLRPLQVDPYGNILNWPDGFFGDEMGDLAAMTEAAMKRKMKKAG
jgi:predicted ATPase